MAVPLRVLLVDDDTNICRTLQLSLKDLDCTVDTAGSVPKAVEKLKKQTFDLILTDFRMEGQTGLDLVREARALDRHALVVVMTAFASYENAVTVVKEGAFDYLPKPFTTPQLAYLLEKVRSVAALKEENTALKRSRARRDYFAGLTSAPSARLEEFVRKVAPTDGTVLLVGESGTGKSELARLIHDLSPRAARQFVTVNCTALAESLLESELFGHVKGAFTGAIGDKAGKLEAADGGTLFLDEIGDLPLTGQAKLLRFLQDRVFERVGSNREITVDTRVVAATNKNLEEAVAAGKFRDDLYYRLNMLECRLVALRFCAEDVPVLVRKILSELKARFPWAPDELPEEVMKRLLSYSWPGNTRELRNVLERLLMLSERGRRIEATDLPDSVQRSQQAKPGQMMEGPIQTLEELERSHIMHVLARETNLEKAAHALGITTVTLWRKRKEYGLP